MLDAALCSQREGGWPSSGVLSNLVVIKKDHLLDSPETTP
jgi:hypothetical protein